MKARVVAAPVTFIEGGYQMKIPHTNLWVTEVDVTNVAHLQNAIELLKVQNPLPEGQGALIYIRVLKGSRKVAGFDKWEAANVRFLEVRPEVNHE